MDWFFPMKPNPLMANLIEEDVDTMVYATGYLGEKNVYSILLNNMYM